MSSSSTNFDQLFQKLLDGVRVMKMHERLLRETAYRAARAYNTLWRDHHNRFVEQLNSYDKDIDALVDDWFAPVAVIGENPHDLIRAIREGMTERQWMEQPARLYLSTKARGRQLKTAAAHEAALTPQPLEDSSPEVQLAQYRLRDSQTATELKSLRREADELKREVGELKRENAQLRVDIAAALRRLTRSAKKVA